MSELLVVDGARVVVLALEIDASEKFKYVIHEMRDMTRVLVQRGGVNGRGR